MRTRATHPPVVFVQWRDAASAAGRWEDRETAIKDALHYSTDPIVAAGFLLADSKDTLVIGLLLNHHNDDAGHVVAIPRGMVTDLRVIRPARGWEPS